VQRRYLKHAHFRVVQTSYAPPALSGNLLSPSPGIFGGFGEHLDFFTSDLGVEKQRRLGGKYYPDSTKGVYRVVPEGQRRLINANRLS